MRRYTAPLSLTALVCFMGTLQSIAVTFVMEHRPSVWTIGWDMNLLAAAYAVSTCSLSLSHLCFSLKVCLIVILCYIYPRVWLQGIVSSSISYYVQGLVMEKRGPVFVTAFSPLMMIIVAIMGSFILAEKIYLGGYVIHFTSSISIQSSKFPQFSSPRKHTKFHCHSSHSQQ